SLINVTASLPLPCTLFHLPPTCRCRLFFSCYRDPRLLHSFPTRRSSDLGQLPSVERNVESVSPLARPILRRPTGSAQDRGLVGRSEEHTSELQSRENLVCRLLLEKKKKHKY